MKDLRLTGVVLAGLMAALAATGAERQLKVADYRDKMAAAWLGQSFGVAYGWATEFSACGTLMPERSIPEWRPEYINETFGQDDLYVEMTFLATLEKRGLGVTPRAAGLDFANSGYPLWCANYNARENLRKGIAPPSSSHPSNHPTTDDIDYQIEADFAGILSPGLPGRVLKLGETFGRIMNYGDGLYAGEFVGAMYAEAFFETNRERVVEVALKAIPADSGYAAMVRDVLAWYRADRGDGAAWERTWAKIIAKYYQNPETAGKVSNSKIDVKVNGALVLLGFLYGEGDVQRTARITTRGGLDSDCNPSTALGILGAQRGTAAFASFKCLESLSRTMKWSHTDYTWDALLAVSERLTREIVVAEGGRIAAGADGAETFFIPEQTLAVGAAESSARPGPDGNERYTAAELAEVAALPGSGGQGWPTIWKWEAGPILKDGDTLAFLGDSITEFGQMKPAGYVNLVLRALKVCGYTNVTPVKAGVGGHKSNDMLARLDKDVLSKRPQVMTLSCGVNDVWHGARGVPLEAFRTNICTILDKAAASNVTVVVMTPTVINENPYHHCNQALRAYSDFLRAEARRRHLRLADVGDRIAGTIAGLRQWRMAAGLPDNYPELFVTVDNVHLNFEGDCALAWEVLRALGIDLTPERRAAIEADWLSISDAYELRVKLSGKEYRELRKESGGRTLNETARERWFGGK